MKLKKKEYCFYCQDTKATKSRNIITFRNNDRRPFVFNVLLCDECNELSDDFLNNYFNT